MNATPAEAAIGHEFRAWRQRRGLTILQLAAKSGVSKASIERIEKATHAINMSHALRLASALDVRLSDIIERAEGAMEIDEAWGDAARNEDLEKRRLSDD